MAEGRVSQEWTADTSSAERSMAKLQAKYISLEAQIKKMAETSKRTSKEHGKALSSSFDKGVEKQNRLVIGQKEFTNAITNSVLAVGRVVAGFGVVGIALNKVRQLFQKFRAEIDELGDANRTQEQWDAQFAQLAGGDAKKQAEFIRQRKEFQRLGGVPFGPQGPMEAAKAIFKLESSGINTKANRELMASLYGIMEGNMGDVAESAAGIIKALGEKETGTLRQIISKSIIASKPSPESPTVLLKAVADAAPAGRLLGMTDEELMAAIGVIAQPAGGSEAAGEMASMFMTAISKQGMLEGKTRSEILPFLTSLNLAPEQYEGILGEEMTGALYDWASTARGKKGTGPGGVHKVMRYKGANIKEILTGLAGEGLTDEELNQRLSPELANMLQTSVEQFGESFRGAPLSETVSRIEAMNLLPPQMMEMFGRRKQALQFYSFISQAMKQGTYQQLLEETVQANTKDQVTGMVAANKLQPGIRASQELRLVEAAYSTNMEDIGALKSIADMLITQTYAARRKDEPFRGYVQKQAQDMLLTYGGAQAVIDLLGTPEQKSLAAMIQGAYTAANAPLGPGRTDTGPMDVIDPEVMKAMTKQIEATEKRQAEIDAEAFANMKYGGLTPQAPRKIAQGNYEQYTEAAKRQGLSGITELTRRLEEQQGFSQRNADVLDKKESGPGYNPASVIPGMDWAEKKLGEGVRFAWKKLQKPHETSGVGWPKESAVGPVFVPPPLGLLVPPASEESGAGLPTTTRMETESTTYGRHSANFGHSAGRYVMSRPARDPNVELDHFGRPKFFGDREENPEAETRSGQFWRKAEEGQSGRGGIMSGGIVNVKDQEATPLLQRAVKALERLVAASSTPAPQQYQGGFKRSRSPAPILRER